MIRFILVRVLWVVPVLLLVSLVTFSLMKLTPGGPWDRDKALAPAVTEELNARYSLDKPGWQQYVLYMAGVAHGDLGPSFVYQDRGVSEIILSGLPATLTLGLAGLLVAFGVGIPLGVLAAVHHNHFADYLALALTTLLGSVPSFVLGFVLIVVVALSLHWLPTSGWGTPGQIVLPALTLGLSEAAQLARVTRAATLDAAGQDYVRTAHAKGLAPRLILLRHVLRNALVPILSLLGPTIFFLLTGSVVIETIFSIPGDGRLLVQGIGQRDYGLIMGATLFYALLVTLLNLVVDLAYGLADPRLRYGESTSHL